MRYAQLGKTGVKVSALGYGASALGGVFGEIEEAEGIRTVHAALDLGINLLDVAPFYGLTRAETVLGKALRTVPRERFFLATKVGRYGMADFDFSASRVIRSVEESLQRLQIETIDLIQCHDIEFGALDQIASETIPALRTLQQQGKVRFVGITGLPLKIYRTVMDKTDVDTVLSYCHYTLNDTSLESLLPYFQEKGVGILNAAPLAMGLLSGNPLPDWHPAPPVLRAAVARAAELCRARNADLAQLALQFALANPRIHSTIVGTGSPQEIARNAACVETPPDAELLADVQAILAPVHNLTWPSGRPENND